MEFYQKPEKSGFQPELEPLKLNFITSDADPEIKPLLQELQKVAESLLRHWKTFPLVLPQPLTIQNDGEGTSRRKTFQIRELFVVPSFEEKELASIDACRKTQRLNAEQLVTIRNESFYDGVYSCWRELNDDQLKNVRRQGEFSVESTSFPGQNHTWKLSPLLQKGKVRTAETFMNDLALATSLLVVTARERINGSSFSLGSSLESIRVGFWMLLDALFGVPSLCSTNLTSKLNDERSRFLVAELICPPTTEEDMDSLCRFIIDQLGGTHHEKNSAAEQEKVPPVPYTFTTPSGLEIDLRHFCRNSMKRAMPLLVSILEKESRGWFLHFRETIVAEMKKRQLDDWEIEKEAQRLVMEEYLRRVYIAIRTNDDINAICSGFGELLVEQAQCCVSMIQSLETCQRTLENRIKEKQKELEFSHPILSRIKPWLRKEIGKARKQLMMKMMYKCHEDALQFCRENGLRQSAYFLSRDLMFIKERAAVIAEELNQAENPSRIFEWRTLIWRHSQWSVRKMPQIEAAPSALTGQSLLSTSASRVTGSQIGYLLVKHHIRTTNTQWPFWRWNNFFHRTWMVFWNLLFFLLVAVPWYSPVSLRSIISFEPFYPYLELSQANGTLIRKRSKPVPTLCSRLLGLLRHISKARTEFESTPDTGFVGKSFSRYLNCLWNYGVKGFLGSFALLIGFPLLCVVSCFISLTLAVFSPIWIPALVLLYHVGLVLIYDVDSPDSSRVPWCVIGQAIVFHLVIGGIVQPIVCLALAAGVLPALAFIVFLGSVLRYIVRSFWDSIMFHLLIKPKGRIPAMEGFFVKRIDGPGLKQDFKYRISREQALAAFEAKMECDELSAYRKETEKLIRKPLVDFTAFTNQLFLPFGLPSVQFPLKTDATTPQEGLAQVLDRETQSLLASLEDRVEKRIQDMQLGLGVETRSRIRLAADDLRIILVQASLLLQEFYPDHVLQRLGMTTNDMWTRHGLQEGDWSALAALFLAEVFSSDVLLPLNEREPYYWLEKRRANLSRYTSMLEKLESNPDLPNFLNLIPVCSSIRVPSPYLDVAVFSPLSKNVLGKFEGTSGKAEKKDTGRWFAKGRKASNEPKSVGDSVNIPLPIPHPALISVLIYNRDAEERDAVPLDNELVRGLLRSLEGIPAQSVPVTPGVHTIGKSSSSQNRLLSESSFGNYSQSRQGSLDSVSSIPTAVSPESQGTIVSEGTPHRQFGITKTEVVQEYRDDDRRSSEPLFSASPIEVLLSSPAVTTLRPSRGNLKQSDSDVVFPLESQNSPLFGDVRGTSTPINRESYPIGLSQSSPQVPVLQIAMLQKKEQWLLGSQSALSNISISGSRQSTPGLSTPVNYPSPNVRHKMPKAPVPLSDLPHLSRCLLTAENPLDAAALAKSTSQDSIMFVEEGLSLVESPNTSQNFSLRPGPSEEKLGSNLTLTSSPVAVDVLHLASFEDLSLVTTENEKRYDTPV